MIEERDTSWSVLVAGDRPVSLVEVLLLSQEHSERCERDAETGAVEEPEVRHTARQSHRDQRALSAFVRSVPVAWFA